MPPLARRATTAHSAVPSPLAPGKRWVFRLCAAVLAPLALFAVLETALRLTGFGYPTKFFRPETIGGRPVFVENRKFGWRFFPPAIAREPGTLVLPSAKAPATRRIFVFGESAAYGDPNAAFAFSRHLALLLQERYPGNRFEVVNVAMTAINSHVILPIARECAGHEGDLWVIYAGNNEVVGPYGAGTAFGRQTPPLAFIRASLAAKSTRAGQLLSRLTDSITAPRDPRRWLGMEMMQTRVASDDPRLSRTYEHFRQNVQEIVSAGLGARAKIILCTVASNLRDCAPFASVHRSPAANPGWTEAFESGGTAENAGRTVEALNHYRRAAAIDDGHAETAFRLARCELALSNNLEAARWFARARDLDALRFRADSRLNSAVRELAGRWPTEKVQLVDAERAFNEASPAGIAGNDLFYEHVHLNFSGNYLLARKVAEAAARLLPGLNDQSTTVDWLPEERCAEALAFSDATRLAIAEMLRDRMSQPPFTAQCDHSNRVNELRDRIVGLRRRVTPAALGDIAELNRRAAAREPGDWMLQEGLARALFQTGDFPGAAKAAHAVTEIVPQRAEGWTQLGLSLGQVGQNQEAEQALCHALVLRPGDALAYYGLGWVRLRENRFGEAKDLFLASRNAQPDSADAEAALGQALAALGEGKEALAHYRRSLALNPAHPFARSNLLQVMNQGGQLTEKIHLFQTAVDSDPQDVTARLGLGQSLFLAGRHAEAAPHFAAAVALGPEIAEAQYYQGLEMARQERMEDAARCFAEAVRLQPNDIDARMNYGVSLAKTRNFAGAAAQFEVVLRLQPDNALARKYLELARSRDGKAPAGTGRP